MPDKVLVTGAGGCIGAWVLRQLLESGATPIAFDLQDDRRRPALLCDDAHAVSEMQWETGDIADTARVQQVIAAHRPDAIIHLAALQVPFCRADPPGGARVNVLGTVNVFEAARQAGVQRIAYASSVAADAMEDTAAGWMQTLYGAYKICNELCARVYWQEHGLGSTGIRPSVVYGAGRDQGMSAMPSLAMLAACAGQRCEVPFCGAVGFVYAAEAAAAFVQAVAAAREGAEVFNLNGTARTVEEVLADIRTRVPAAEVACSGSALPFPAELSDAPLRAHIGDYRQYTFDEGLDETLDLFHRRLREGRLDAAATLQGAA